MKKYFELISKIDNSYDETITDIDLIISLILKECIKLFYYIDAEIKQRSLLTINPLLRQIYEFVVIVVGLEEQLITLSEFVMPLQGKNYVNLPEKIIKQIAKKSSSDLNSKLFLESIRMIKMQLNNYTHGSFEKLMTGLIENHGSSSVIDFIIDANLVTYGFIENFFIGIVNTKYNMSYPEPEIKINLNKLNELSNRNEIAIEEKLYERLLEIPEVNAYLIKIAEVSKEQLEKFKNLHKND